MIMILVRGTGYVTVVSMILSVHLTCQLLHTSFVFLQQNEKLKEEQELLLQHLLKTARDANKLYENEEIKSRDDVIVSMKDKWNRQREREKELEGRALSVESCSSCSVILMGGTALCLAMLTGS